MLRTTQDPATFWRKLFPIRRAELKKFILLLLLNFALTFVYFLLASIKATVIVTAEQSGAEAISVLKGFVVLPISILCAWLCTKLCTIFKHSTLFYGSVAFFTFLIGLYAFVLYPRQAALVPHASAVWLSSQWGGQHGHWIAVYRNWLHSLFYVVAELWGQVLLHWLYWALVNQIFSLEQAKRTYMLFSAVGNSALIFSGLLVYHYAQQHGALDFGYTVQTLAKWVIGSAILIVFLYGSLHRYVLAGRAEVALPKPQPTLSWRKRWHHIWASPQLIGIAILVIACALSINLGDITWKAMVKSQYPHTADYQQYIALFDVGIGTVSLVIGLFFSGYFARRWPWQHSVQISPVLIGTLGSLFFVIVHYQASLGRLAGWWGMTPIVLVTMFGTVYNVLARASRLLFFEPTKEMAYIPLDDVAKQKGKAAIDIVGSKAGKSLSSYLQLGLMYMAGTSTVFSIAPFLLAFLSLTSCVWSYTGHRLGKRMLAKQKA